MIFISIVIKDYDLHQHRHHDDDQVKQASHSFVFFTRSSREKADLLRALVDGFADLIIIIIIMRIAIMMPMFMLIKMFMTITMRMTIMMLTLNRSTYLEDQKGCLMRSVKTCNSCCQQVILSSSLLASPSSSPPPSPPSPSSSSP